MTNCMIFIFVVLQLERFGKLLIRFTAWQMLEDTDI